MCDVVVGTEASDGGNGTAGAEIMVILDGRIATTVETVFEFFSTDLLFVDSEFCRCILHVPLVVGLKVLLHKGYIHLPTTFRAMSIRLAQ